MSQDLRHVNDIESLIKYFSEKLGWNIDPGDCEDIDDITYDFEASDLGLKEEAFAKITSLKQLPPLVDGQQWGIFFVNFDSEQFEVSALRKILSGLIPARRNKNHAVWEKKDLLFICTWGNQNQKTIGIAHFEDVERGLPQIKMISCAPEVEDFTQINVFEEHLKALTWPQNTKCSVDWYTAWSSAFKTTYRQNIQDSKTLTVRLAVEAKNIRDRILASLAIETENGYVHKLFQKFRDTLVHDMTEQQFADMYAQTVVYGLFSARCMDKTQDDFSAIEAVECIPNTNPFLKSLLNECLGSAHGNGKLSFDELEIGNIIDLLLHTKTDLIIEDFNRQTGGGKEDPVIHFYEDFLAEYDSSQRVQRGVYYTPQPVVNFIVRAVDDILKQEFGIEDGLASTETKTIKYLRQSKRKVNGYSYGLVEDTKEVPAIQVLDPATGTGTFLRQTILKIYQNFCDKRKNMPKNQVQAEWNEYVPQHLLPRLNGFELMMAPYAVAHMKLAMVLKETGYNFNSKERLQVFLTNTLEEPGDSDLNVSLFADPLALESVSANIAKKNSGINVVIGNPPYSGESSNKGKWITDLMNDYKYEPGTKHKLKESNSKFINDDYMKFVRFAQYILNNSDDGILCFINPHGFIDNPTFRGVRWNLINFFQEIYILDLHGNSKKKEKMPNGGKDENIFDIQQGVSINIFIKKRNLTHLAMVHHFDLYGDRADKYKYLSEVNFKDVSWKKSDLMSPNYLYNHENNKVEDDYNNGFSVRELFDLGTLGVLSKRDSLVVDFRRDALERKIDVFISPELSVDQVCAQFKIPIKDNDKWDAGKVRNELLSIPNKINYLTTVHYRPFDIRHLFYYPSIIARPNVKVLKHIQYYKNIALILCRQGGASNLEHWDCIFAVNTICDQNIYRRGGGTVLPLYRYEDLEDNITRKVNFKMDIIYEFEKRLCAKLTLEDVTKNNCFTPEDIIAYIYAVLHSNLYRDKFMEYLSKDFPKVPYPNDYKYFRRLVDLGKELLKVHLNFREANSDVVSYQGEGNNSVEKIELKEEKLFINKTQYFYSVSQNVFDFTVGGFSPVQKWLKDRKGEILNSEEIKNLAKIIIAVNKTITIMTEIDCNIKF